MGGYLRNLSVSTRQQGVPSVTRVGLGDMIGQEISHLPRPEAGQHAQALLCANLKFVSAMHRYHSSTLKTHTRYPSTPHSPRTKHIPSAPASRARPSRTLTVAPSAPPPRTPRRRRHRRTLYVLPFRLQPCSLLSQLLSYHVLLLLCTNYYLRRLLPRFAPINCHRLLCRPLRSRHCRRPRLHRRAHPCLPRLLYYPRILHRVVHTHENARALHAQ